jgi:hypothetical protein
MCVLLAGCRSDGLRRSNVVPTPRSNEPEPRLLADGTPVFVVAKRGALPVVVEAVSTHVAWGVTKLVGWCQGSNTFVDIHGSRWDTFGTKRGGPASSGLATFAVTRLNGSNKLRVGRRVPGAPIGTRSVPPSGPSCEFENGAKVVDIAGTRRVSTPADLRANEWDRVKGVLVTSADRHARLCPKATASAKPPCAGGLDAPGVERPFGHGWGGKADEYLVYRRGNVVLRIL